MTVRGLKWARVASLVLLPGMLTAVSPSTALAECTSLDPWPSFRAAAPSAKRIIVGHVAWTPGNTLNNHFTFAVDETLRGSAPDQIEFRAFKSGMPTPICPGDSVLRGRPGDRFAIAYGAVFPGVIGTIDAVALVKPIEADTEGFLAFMLPKMERLTLDQVHAAASMPATATSPAASSEDQTVPSVWVGVLLAAFWLTRRLRSREGLAGGEAVSRTGG